MTIGDNDRFEPIPLTPEDKCKTCSSNAPLSSTLDLPRECIGCIKEGVNTNWSDREGLGQ